MLEGREWDVLGEQDLRVPQELEEKPVRQEGVVGTAGGWCPLAYCYLAQVEISDFPKLAILT